MENKGTGNSNKKKSALPVWALIFAFIFPPAGFILSIISLAMKKRKTGMSITALVLSILNAIIVLIVIALLIILSPYIFVYSLFLPLFALTKAVDSSYSEADATKELTNYFSDSPIVSARIYYPDGNGDGYKCEEIPDEYLDLFVDTLNSLTIVKSSTFNGDYYYGWRQYIECTLEDGSEFRYDGEELYYRYPDGEKSTSRFVFVKEHFWNTMENYNKKARVPEKTEIAVYGFIDSSDKKDFIYETEDGYYITLNNKLYSYSEGCQELIFECDENLGPVIYATDEYILFIQRSEVREKIKKLDLNSGDIIEEYDYEIDKFKEAFLDENNEYFFAYDNSQILSLNVKEDEVYNLHSFVTSDDAKVLCTYKDLPEGYYAKHENDYRSNYSYNDIRLYFYKETEDGEELLKFHNSKSLELSVSNSYPNVDKGDSLFMIETSRKRFSLEWEKDIISTIESNNIYKYSNRETIYEDESKRIIGYNPDNKIVYLYSMEDNSISMKNIENGGETVIDVLEDYDKIEFEWEESKLYLRCTKDENETFGGCYDFGE